PLAADALPTLGAPVARLLRPHLGDLPPPGRRRGHRSGPLASALALAALVGAPGLRSDQRRLCARLECRPELARRLRAARPRDGRPRPAARRAGAAAAPPPPGGRAPPGPLRPSS